MHLLPKARDKWRTCPNCNILFQAAPVRIVSCPGCQTNQIHEDKGNFVEWERGSAAVEQRSTLSHQDRFYQSEHKARQTFFQTLLTQWKRYRVAFEKFCVMYWPIDLFTFTLEERRALRLAARDSFTFSKITDPRIAKWLSHRGGQWAISKLQTIQPDIAKHLVRTSDALRLNGIQYIDDSLASTLAKHRGRTLYLDNLHHIDIEVLEILVRHAGRGLSLSGLNDLSIQEAAILSNYRGRLSVNGLANPDSTTLAALVQHSGKSMSLSSLKSLSHSQAKQFARYKGDLYLRGLREIPREADSEFDNFSGKIVLKHHERHPLSHIAAVDNQSGNAMTHIGLWIVMAACVAILLVLLISGLKII
ncbi:MAG: hypothetical protein HN703_08015 [Planctomycetaceae bacterium]|nr:hypothetical protein [Planctomycetaceae bacterium]